MPASPGSSINALGAYYSSPLIQIADTVSGAQVSALKGPVLTVVYQRPVPEGGYSAT
jgi:hypothetical protein